MRPLRAFAPLRLLPQQVQAPSYQRFISDSTGELSEFLSFGCPSRPFYIREIRVIRGQIAFRN